MCESKQLGVNNVIFFGGAVVNAGIRMDELVTCGHALERWGSIFVQED